MAKRGGASAGAPGGKKLREGYEFDAGQRHQFPGPRSDQEKLKLLDPVPGTDPDQDAILTFSYTTGPRELLRFNPQPIFVQYLYSKKQTPSTDAAATAAQKADRLYAVHDNESERLLIDPASATNFFFSKAEVIIDGQNVSEMMRDLGRHTGYYLGAQRGFLPPAERGDLFGESLSIKSQEDRKKDSDTGKALSVKTMTFDSSLTPLPRSIELGFPGTPFLSHPRDALLSKLEGREMSRGYPYLPPGTEIVIRLHRSGPDYLYLDRLDDYSTEDPLYFSHRAGTKDLFDKGILEMKSVKLCAQSLKLSPADGASYTQRLENRNLPYRFDHPVFDIYKLPAGSKEVTTSFKLDPKVSLCYVGFCWQDQNYLNEQKKKACSFRVTLPPQLVKISFAYNGDNLHFENGLAGLAGDGVGGSLDIRRFDAYLRQRGWLDLDDPEYFPRHRGVGYRCYFPLDLTAFETGQGGEMLVTAEFDETNCPQDASLFCISVRPQVLERVVNKNAARKITWSVAPE